MIKDITNAETMIYSRMNIELLWFQSLVECHGSLQKEKRDQMIYMKVKSQNFHICMSCSINCFDSSRVVITLPSKHHSEDTDASVCYKEHFY